MLAVACGAVMMEILSAMKIEVGQCYQYYINEVW
jgi:hypothetical protein